MDYGQGSSPYLQTPTSTGRLNSINARVDFQLIPALRLFARYANTPSATHGLSTSGPFTQELSGRNRVYLVGADGVVSSRIANELRLQYSSVVFVAVNRPIQVGGGAKVDLQGLEGLPSTGGESVIHISLPTTSHIYQVNFGSQQFQSNATDALTWTHGRHLFKFGADYRQTTAYYNNEKISRSPYVAYGYTSASAILLNTASFTAQNQLRVDPTSKNLGIFAQDEWRMLPRLSLSLGLRWDLNPPPSVSGTQAYTYTGDINNPSTLAISSQPGGAIYKTTYSNFAPRFGMALTIHNQPGHELVLRTGAGLFYDLIAINGFFGSGTGLGTAATSTGKTAFPLQASQILVPVTAPKAPYTLQFYPLNDIVPPSAIQWNVSVEQALGSKQTVTMGYVGSVARNLVRYQQY
ncbi:MAG: TonB-dependent receptor plug [Edaphobacter sp.]|nr:TonB-dependent receptor plug [Edaphobacter sp.]